MDNPVAEWVDKLGRIGRYVDAFEVEKLEPQKYRVDLFERGAFMESVILHCRDEDVDSISAQIKTKMGEH